MDFTSLTHIPQNVIQAQKLSQKLGFEQSCSYELGRLIRTLVAQAKAGTVAEIGSGCGVSSSWMLSGLRDDQTFISIERNEVQHRGVKKLFEATSNATFIQGDWQNILKHAPFELVFVDVGVAKDHGSKKVIAATAIGGLMILDDFTPHKYWPKDWKGREDQRRARWLSHDCLVATEILLTERNSVILATRVC